ncbi:MULTISPECIES: cytochrome P450 [Xanthomonas]|uniref:cytochrome P450 n=1 Tax=Xanthomonas TaxID=338 RepID=UPI0018734170
MVLRVTETGRLPPGPRGHWAFGNRHAFTADPLGFLQASARTYGDVVRIAERTYLLAAPATIAQVLGDDGALYAKTDPDPRARRAAFPASVMNSDGTEWRHKRRTLQPAFRASLVRAYAMQASAATQALLRTHDDTDPAQDLRPTMTALCAQLGAGFLLGDATQAPALLRMLPMVDAILQQTRTPSAAPAWWPSVGKRRLTAARGALDVALTQILDTSSPAGTDSMLELLRRDDPHGRSDWRRDEAAAMLMSALEPMAAGLTWTLLLLAQHPSLAQAVAEEADAATDLDAASDDACGDALIERLPLARACVKEAMRLYPPAWMTARIAQRETTLDGFAVPRGTQLIVSQWVVQRDPRHFAEPERFVPARWLQTAAHAPARYTYFPFGGGPRSCIGSMLAQVQMTVVVASLLRLRTLHLAADARPTPFPALVLRPLDVRIALRPRTASVALTSHAAIAASLSYPPEPPHG